MDGPLPRAGDQRHGEGCDGPRGGAEAKDPLAANTPLGRHAAGDVAEGVAVVEGAQDDALLLRAPVQLAPRLSLVQGKKEQCIQG